MKRKLFILLFLSLLQIKTFSQERSGNLKSKKSASNRGAIKQMDHFDKRTEASTSNNGTSYRMRYYMRIFSKLNGNGFGRPTYRTPANKKKGILGQGREFGGNYKYKPNKKKGIL